MELNLDLSIVEQCTVNECAYNENSLCHAKAITIGDGEIPHCDTLFRKGPEYHFAKSVAGVGACKVSNCIHNDQLECGARSISVGAMDGEVKCLTFTAE
ncbi:MAG: DUF1540 domain-containing protein [Gammaproteobacteria bacterium]|nr:DUF1540 domain-containing protein [Gammaproteobacteria bacterium]